TYADKLTKEEGLIDWSRPARTIHNQVRGLYPWPHAYTYFNGERLIVWRTRVSESAGRDTARDTDSGTIIDVTTNAITLATGPGDLGILELQREGKRPMAVRDFLAGRSVTAGNRFSHP